MALFREDAVFGFTLDLTFADKSSCLYGLHVITTVFPRTPLRTFLRVCLGKGLMSRGKICYSIRISNRGWLVSSVFIWKLSPTSNMKGACCSMTLFLVPLHGCFMDDVGGFCLGHRYISMWYSFNIVFSI